MLQEAVTPEELADDSEYKDIVEVGGSAAHREHTWLARLCCCGGLCCGGRWGPCVEITLQEYVNGEKSERQGFYCLILKDT